MAIKYRYKGSGFLPGIPARDLDDADLAALSERDAQALKDHMALGSDKAPDGPPDESRDDKAARLAAHKEESERLAASRIYEAVGAHAPPPDNE